MPQLCAAAGNGADNEQRLLSGGYRFGQRIVGRVVREVFFAGEKAKEGTALERVVIADGSLQRGVAGFKGVEDCAQGNGSGDLQCNFALDTREVAQVVGDLDADGAGCGRHGFLQGAEAGDSEPGRFIIGCNFYLLGLPSSARSECVKRFLFVAAAMAFLIAGGPVMNAQDAAKDAGINGKWHFVLDTPGGDREMDAEFTVDADGKVTGKYGDTDVLGTYKDGKMDLAFPMTSEEADETATLKLDGRLDDTRALTGTWEFSEYSGTFKATRPKE